MNPTCSLIIATVVVVPISYVAQQTPHSPTATASDAKLESAIETIAMSDDSSAVRDAAAVLRSGGIKAINALARHTHDGRKARSNFLTRAVTGEVSMGDHCFWLIQDQLEDHTSKMDARFSPLNRENITEWLATRSGMSLAELRRDACIGSFRSILDFEKQHPDVDISPTLRLYVAKLVDLDAAVRDTDNNGSDAEASKASF